MPLNLSQRQEEYLRKHFNLSYHINYLDIFCQKISIRGMNVLEVGGALPATLVIDHLGCNSWTAVEAPSYDQELGKVNQYHQNLAEEKRLLEIGQRYRRYYCNIEDLGDEELESYDVIFSIACFEHVNRLPSALKKMLQCLKPGGTLFTMHSPIWSAFDGHHLPIGIPKRFETQMPHQKYIFLPWGHLLQSRSQTYMDISTRFDCSFAEEVIYYTYNSNHINRYFSEDYRVLFDASGFEVADYRLTFPRHPPAEIQAALESRYPAYKEFSNNGIYAILRRPVH
jgi:SAM-dependent methyltransferase